MNDIKPGILALCDTEEEYAQLLTEFLRKHRDLPWELHTYTSLQELMKEEQRTQPAMLVVAESVFCEEMKTLQPGQIVILNESGVMKWADLRNINKYQQAENVLKELLEEYMNVADKPLPRLKGAGKIKIIGIYSPVRRCLQTSFSLTLSQLLAEERRTLYLNFEHYAGITGLLPDMQVRDMADLLYFLCAEGDTFRLRMQTLIHKKGRLDYIPPMKAGQNLLSVTSDEWLKLLQKIEELGEYEYVVLDLSDSIQGLFEILRRCRKIFTLTKDDRIAQSKLLQYEQLLALCQYEDVLEKTNRLSLPQLGRLPEELEQYTRGELGDYVRGIVKELVEAEEREHYVM